MNQQTPAEQTNTSQQLMRADVLCRISSNDLLAAVESHPRVLEQIGFTGIVIPDEVDASTDAIRNLGIRILRESDLPAGLDLAAEASKTGWVASDGWARLESKPEITFGLEISADTPASEAATLMQMSVPPVPVVPVTEALLYSSVLREQRELLRSAVFWRKRFEIARHPANLVHAGEDGLLIFFLDSWLVAINQNPDEASIDLGNHGSMWLMLASQRDVHLHGSMLILPPQSGAVVANELAR